MEEIYNKANYCLNCKINICVLCKTKHEENHNIINYVQKEYKCPIHFDSHSNTATIVK